MLVTEKRRRVTIDLPIPILERAGELAKRNHATLEMELATLVESGLESELSVREKLDRLSEVYRDRLAREGKLNQSGEDVMDELRRIREQVADELYPD